MEQRYEVTLEMMVYAPVKVIVTADDKDSAVQAASALVAGSVGDAMHSKNQGWKASVNVKPPKGVSLASTDLKATVIAQTSGGEKARKL